MANGRAILMAVVVAWGFSCYSYANTEFANQWAVYMHGGLEVAKQVALEHGFRCIGPVGMLKDVYLFTHRAVPRRYKRSTTFRNVVLSRDKRVDLVVQQEIKKRVKREAKDIHFSDHCWGNQWYLHNRDPGMTGHDMNILPAWKKGITGKNVVITILDDGIEYTHKELVKNYDRNASYDYNDNDADPRPRWTLETNQFRRNGHGTRCAGQIAATGNNSFCIVGVAYDSKIGGIRMLDGEVTDAVEARSLTHRRDYVDVYSSSWGPDDDGRTVDGPGNLTTQALIEGILFGRNGKGSIFVWASGNGGTNDDCNCDGYTNSIYTISAGAATSYGSRPWYLEECASTLISSYGGGNNDLSIVKINKIVSGRNFKSLVPIPTFVAQEVTSDLNGGCTLRHTGTSVAAPFAAGFIALALEAKPELTWRDVQHVLVNSANIRNLDQHNVQVNGVNKKFSPTFGFGLLDGGALVDLAEKWSLVSEQHICKTAIARPALRGALSIYLVSPMGTRSRVLSRRKLDTRRGSFKKWAFLSVHFWGENPYGKWKLEIDSAHGTGLLEEWQLVMYGTEFTPGVPYPDIDDQPLVPGQKGVRCHPECLEGCTGPEPYQCISCKNYMLVDGNKTCVPICPAKYFTDEISLLCLPCHNACWSCVGPSSVQYHFKLIHEVGFKCNKCHGNCLTCSGKADNCTTCRHEDFLSNHNCIPRCGHGYFFDGLNCIPCHGSCHTCDGRGYRNCTSCRYRGLHSNNDYKTMYFYKGSCLFTCPPRYYRDHTKGVCEPCGKNCLKCVAEGEQCVACKWGHFLPALNKKDCIKECPRGQYPDLLNGLCILCSKNCESCIPGKPFECLSCKSSLFDPRMLKQSTCVSDCGIGFFSNSTSNMCQVCPYPCSDCKGDKNCENCYVNLNEERCLEACPSGTFRDIEQRFRCTRCHSSCKECSGEHLHQCLECPREMVLRADGRCSWTCPPGAFYKDLKEQICKPCHPSCTQCFGPTEKECRRCVGNLKLRGSTCIQPCIDNLTENSCNNCHPKCKSCFGATETECLSCHPNKTLYEYHCTERCPRGYYKVPGGMCMPCHKTCSTCHGNLSTQCDSCASDLKLFENRCVLRCPMGYFKMDEWCLKCSDRCVECQYSEDVCMRCKEGYVRRDLGCHVSCGDGSFEVPGTRQCEKCHRNCKTCFGFNANQCLSCHHGMLLYKSVCFEECPSRYIAEAPTSMCNNCPENCITCFTEGNMSICEHCRYPFVIHKGECIRSCPLIGYYTDFYTKSCKQCHDTCDICYGPDKDECMLCKKGLSQVGSLCVEETCKEGYYIDAESLKCKKCHLSCRSCRGPSVRQCTECYGDYILHRNRCILGCDADKYPDQKTGICRFCDPSCQTCVGPTSRNCTGCFKEHILVDGKCILNCADGKYLNKFTGQCIPCHKRCKGCNGPDYNNCTDCRSDKILSSSGACVKRCPSGFFAEPISERCQSCSPLCKNCNGPSIKNCTACHNELVLANGRCVHDCKDGSYLDSLSGKCLNCLPPCKECKGPLYECTLCQDGFVLTDGKCLPDCTNGSYPDKTLQVCLLCNSNCKMCDGPFENNCTACLSNSILIDGECVLNCPDGTYSSRMQKTCNACDSSCVTCDGALAIDCTSCKTGYALFDGKCILFCNEGFYPDEEKGKCLPCKSNCKACTGPKKNDCISCKQGFVMRKSECGAGCNEDCFYNEVSGNCEKCTNPCATCYGPSINECISCRANFNLIDSTCFPICKRSEYLDAKSWECKKCANACESCFGPARKNCTLCKPGFTLIESTCFMMCEGGEYRDYASGRCLNCSEGCLACQGPSIADCVICKKGYQLNDRMGCTEVKCTEGRFFDDDTWRCKSCHSDCKSCDGPSKEECLSCNDGYQLLNNTCANICHEGSFYDIENGRCEKCSELCKTCSGPGESNCTSCQKRHILIGNTCRNTCVVGSYYNEETQECELCNDSCLSCDGQNVTDCTSCPPGFMLKNGLCAVECADESYFDLDKLRCLPCSSRCLSCNGPTKSNCTGCFDSLVLRNGSCVQLCKEGTYRNIELDYCMACDSSCKTCHGPGTNDCTACRDNKRLMNGACVSKCIRGYYFDENIEECGKCHPTCVECTGPGANECTRCGEDFLLSKNICHLWCMTGSYPDDSLFKCVQCDATCRECSGPTKNNCTDCYSRHSLKHGVCQVLCSKETYLDTDRNLCQSCDRPCKECIGPGSDNCSSCIDGHELQGQSCIQPCLDGYVDTENKCRACHDACLGCHGPGPGSCNECKYSDKLMGDLCTCKNGYFMNMDTFDCEKCDRTCEKCTGTGPQHCTICADNLFFDHSMKMCSYVCSTGTYFENDACFPCHETCHSCDGKEFKDCLLCNDTLVLYNSTCIEECPDGFYKMTFEKKSICVMCNENCKTCFERSMDQCISCYDDFVLQNGTCRENCTSPYVMDTASKECVIPLEKPFIRKLLSFKDVHSQQTLKSNISSLLENNILLVLSVSFLVLLFAFVLKNR
eukprot:gene5914-11255_t